VFFEDRYLAPSAIMENGFLRERAIDYLGIYSSTICFRDTLEVIRKAGQKRESGEWNGKIMVGGPHVSLFPETVPSEADFVVQGEGENVVADIVEGRVRDRLVAGTPVADLDRLPLPAYDCFQDPRYWTRVDPCPDDPIYTMNTSRGCPFHCRFCSVKGIWGKTYRMFSAKRIVQDIETLVERFGIRGVYFREDHFTFSRERTERFCELLLEKNIHVKWFCESRVSDLDAPLLKKMKRSGCEWIYLGCESGSRRMLDYFQKGITVEQIRRVIEHCREAGIRSHTSWIVGAPTETEGEMNETLELIRECRPSRASINVFVGFPGSELYRELEASGDYCHQDDLGYIYTHRYNELVRRFYGTNAEKFVVNP
jgi:radical SAM superfamily enzyme YgiQ (UPF0313 family)